MIAGICGGIGSTYHLDPTVIRLATVFLCIVTGIVPLAVVYLVGWIIIPQERGPVDASSNGEEERGPR
jgi:phage shock protein C